MFIKSVLIQPDIFYSASVTKPCLGCSGDNFICGPTFYRKWVTQWCSGRFVAFCSCGPIRPSETTVKAVRMLYNRRNQYAINGAPQWRRNRGAERAVAPWSQLEGALPPLSFVAPPLNFNRQQSWLYSPVNPTCSPSSQFRYPQSLRHHPTQNITYGDVSCLPI